MVAFMSQSRKRFNPKSSSQSSKSSVKLNNQSDDFVKRLDTLRTNVKAEHKKLSLNSSQTSRIFGFAIIIVIGMSGVLILSTMNIGHTPTTVGTSGSNIVNSIGKFQQDTNALINKVSGKITFIYVGGEFCPYCAMERWAVVMALEAFGSFSPMPGQITSAEDSVGTYSFDPGYSNFYYTSSKIYFDPVEVYGNSYNPNTQSYNTLNSMDANQKSLYNAYGTGSIPFIIIGGSYFRSGAGPSFSLSSFKDQTFSTINNQVQAKSGSLYNQIVADANIMIQLINKLLTPPTSSTTATTTGA